MSFTGNGRRFNDSPHAGYDINDYQAQPPPPPSTTPETNSLMQHPPPPIRPVNNNIFVLWLTIICVTTMTAALAVAAVFSRSLALTADVVQNAVDISTYGVNLYAEYQALGASGSSKRLELAAAVFSVAGLIGVGAWVLWAALERFHVARLPGHFVGASSHIDAHMLLAFTVLGCAADMFVATIFCKYSATHVVEPPSTAGPLLDLDGTSPSQQQQQQQQASAKNVNMISAGAHVMTDAIRSVTIVVGAFLIFLQHHRVIHLPIQEEVMDGVLSCFVVGCMSIAVLFVLREIYHLIQVQGEEEGSVATFLCESASEEGKMRGKRKQQRQQQQHLLVGSDSRIIENYRDSFEEDIDKRG